MSKKVNLPTIIEKNGDMFLLVERMEEEYPHYCETQCTAWNRHKDYCFRTVMSEDYCAHSLARIKQKISAMSKVNGSKWWKKIKEQLNNEEWNDNGAA